MSKLHTTYQLTITTLSPLHIGSGTKLLRDYDYVTRGDGRTWVINTEALAGLLYDESARDFDKMVEGSPAADFLRPEDFQPGNPLFRYVLRGEPQSQKRGSVVQEIIKDPWDRPYIPGSSLKGALRTALAFAGWQTRDLQFNVEELGRSQSNAAQPLEAKVFAGHETNPNHDLLRVLQVSDSTPDDNRNMLLSNVLVLAGQKTGSPIEVEAIARDVTFTATLTLDGFLRQESIATALGWREDQLKWVRSIARVANHFSHSRLVEEETRWTRYGGSMKSFFETIVRHLNGCAKNEFILQLGWGAGWDSKTFGSILTQNKNTFADIVRKYDRHMNPQKAFHPGDRFPKSRRVVLNRQGEPVALLGWIRVKMERVE